MKVCPECGGEVTPNTHGGGALKVYCSRLCKQRAKGRRSSRRYYANHREAVLAKDRAERDKHREYKRRWYAANIERERERQRRWYAANIETSRERQRAPHRVRYWGDPRLAEVTHMVTRLKEEIRSVHG